MNLSEDMLNNLSPAKRALLMKRLAGNAVAHRETQIPSREDKTQFPLSSSQRGLWVVEKLHGESALCNLAECFRMQGALDVDVLQQSLAVCFERHEILRAGVARGPDPKMIVLETVSVPLKFIDLSLDENSEQLAHIQANEFTEQAINMHDAPLARILLIRASSEVHYLVFVVHHIIGDGWSLGVLVGELQEVYTALLEERPPVLPALGVQYGDYSLWMQSEAAKRHQRLELTEKIVEDLCDAPTLTTFPMDYPRPIKFDIGGSAHRFSVANDISDGLGKLSKKWGVSKFVILFSAFNALLYRFTGQSDLVIATPQANRTLQSLEGLVGMFINPVVYRSHVEGSENFRSLVEQIKQASISAAAAQSVPFEHIVDGVGKRKDLSKHPIFQIMFVYQNWPLPPLALPSVEATRVGVHSGTSKYDLLFTLEEREGVLDAWVEYPTKIYKKETIERISNAYTLLLKSIIQNSESGIAELVIISAEEEQRALLEWNDLSPKLGSLSDLLVHDLIRAVAKENSDKIALLWNDKSLTYGELNKKVCILTEQLLNLGIRPGDHVGIYMERSLNLVPALLACLNMGACYVPLDKRYPQERIEFIVKDADITAFITDSSGHVVLEGIIERIDLLVFNVDDLDDEISATSNTDREILGPCKQNLAYIIYTSGSTGRPKGVAVQHDTLAHYVQSAKQFPGFSEQDSLLAITTIAFDPHILDLLVPLTAAAKIRIGNTLDSTDPVQLMAYMDSDDTTVLQATPSVLKMLVDAGWRGNSKLRALVGAEPLEPNLASTLHKFTKELWNQYGVTECTVWQADLLLQDRHLDQLNSPPVGHPLPGSRIYLLDEVYSVVPVGVIGEIHLGGFGPARGYYNKPGLTAEKFIPDPFTGKQGGRMYRTGDLARYREDGTLEFVGRRDFQVKIRGFRVELGEIQTIIESHEGVKETLVSAISDVDNDKPGTGRTALVAYLISDSDESIDREQLQNALRKKVPDYMMPTYFVELEKLPRNSNGKIDRAQLPKDPNRFQKIFRESEKPANALEESIFKIWSNLLGSSDFGVTDNFFDIGGTSIDMPVLLDQLQKDGHTQLALATLFEYPTIRELALGLSNVMNSENDDELAKKIRLRSEQKRKVNAKRRIRNEIRR